MGISPVIVIAMGIYYFIHFNACTMYLVGKNTDFVGWGAVWSQFATADYGHFYTWCFFQAVGNMFPMSFKPQTQYEQLAAILYIIGGAALYASFLGTISSATMSVNPLGRLYNQKMEELIDYVKWKKLDGITKEKLISYYETKYRGKYFEEDSLLQDMNESLRAAAMPSVLYRLTNTDFHLVISEFPDMQERVQRLAAEGQKHVQVKREKSNAVSAVAAAETAA
ncbi:anaphase-promoting complex subunit Hcn1 [Entophlyctis luteolus]|nr:anaphase-promoting complex subunit Hcn1 [Entophlyctis luteolus]KAJ3394095.1 anaphase-promoting complex subunit Hcn1 [Entophlyctis sp. JEL0112]